MSNLTILDEVAQKLKTTSDKIKFRKELAGTSTAKVTEITWGKDKTGILKQDTTKTEWFFYSNVAKKFKIPAPKTIAISKSSEVPWILIEKIPEFIHPKNWKDNHIEKALREIAKFNAQLMNKQNIKELEPFPKINKEEWSNFQNSLLENVEKATKIAENYKGKTPITKTDLESVKKDLKSKDFIDRFLAAGITLIHGRTWTYNIMQTEKKIYILDWQEIKIAPPAWEFLHFYDLLPFHAETVKTRLSDPPFTFNELMKIYLDEMKKNNVTIALTKFKKSLKAAVSVQIAHIWAPLLKPDVVLLRGGRYFIARTLRLWPSRKTVRQHFIDLLELRKMK